jgi:hypothetical protein
MPGLRAGIADGCNFSADGVFLAQLNSPLAMKHLALLSRIAVASALIVATGFAFNALALFAVAASALVLLIARHDYSRPAVCSYLRATARRVEAMPLAA